MYETLVILKKRQSLLEAHISCYQEFMPFFTKWHDYITRMTGSPLREMYAPEGLNGWLIRIDVEAREEKMAEIRQWAAEHVQSDLASGI